MEDTHKYLKEFHEQFKSYSLKGNTEEEEEFIKSLLTQIEALAMSTGQEGEGGGYKNSDKGITYKNLYASTVKKHLLQLSTNAKKGCRLRLQREQVRNAGLYQQALCD